MNRKFVFNIGINKFKIKFLVRSSQKNQNFVLTIHVSSSHTLKNEETNSKSFWLFHVFSKSNIFYKFSLFLSHVFIMKLKKKKDITTIKKCKNLSKPTVTRRRAPLNFNKKRKTIFATRTSTCCIVYSFLFSGFYYSKTKQWKRNFN